MSDIKKGVSMAVLCVFFAMSIAGCAALWEEMKTDPVGVATEVKDMSIELIKIGMDIAEVVAIMQGKGAFLEFSPMYKDAVYTEPVKKMWMKYDTGLVELVNGNVIGVEIFRK